MEKQINGLINKRESEPTYEGSKRDTNNGSKKEKETPKKNKGQTEDLICYESLRDLSRIITLS